jgi:type VI protein secretion system component VasF
MANLEPTDSKFVAKRERLVKSWPYIGSSLICILAGFAGWMWISNPALINPWFVFSELKAESLPDSTVTLMAAMLPVVVIACFLVVLACLLFTFVAFLNEKRHMAIIRRLLGD